MWKYIFILFLELTDIIKVNFVGTISISGIFFIIWYVFKLSKGEFAKEFKFAPIKKITNLYVALFFFQLISEILVSNTMANAMKGLAITALSYMKFMCLWSYVKDDSKKITFLFFSMALSKGLSFFISGAEFDEEALLEGTEFRVFKYTIAPMIAYMLVVFSLISNKRKFWILMFIYVGSICAILGARSTGLAVFLTGSIALAIDYMGKKLSKSKIIAWSIMGSVIGYGCFVLYVNAVLSGDIVGGNSQAQFTKVENPYNPIYILLAGRKESPASIAAISDRPLTGFGAWAEDPNFKYNKIKFDFADEDFNISRIHANIIPSHSVILGYGVNDGVFAMITVALLIFFFISKGAKSLRKGSMYNCMIAYCIVSLIWNGLFSPTSRLRNSFPIIFCCCLFAYRQSVLERNRTYIMGNV